MGTMATEAIEERIKNDKYDYPIVLPLRLKRVMDQRDEILRRDDEARLAKDPERQDRDQERKMYEDESLIQAVVLRREAHVIQGKKAQLAWEFKGVDFDPLANKKEEDPDAWKTWKKKKEVRACLEGYFDRAVLTRCLFLCLCACLCVSVCACVLSRWTRGPSWLGSFHHPKTRNPDGGL